MIRRRTLLAAAAALVVARTGRAAPRQALTAADVHVDGYPTVMAVRRIGEILERETGGRLGTRVYHAGQLGREGDTVNLARFGALDITRVNMAALNNMFPATRILSLPYVFDSVAHLRRALDGEPGRAILREFERRDLVGLAFYDAGARCFYNARHPVRAPADLAGLKIRVPPSDIFMDLVRTLGANPTPLAFGEVFSALQTGLIDGAENNWQTYHTSRQFEVAHDWSQTEHSYSPEALLMSRARFDALAPPDRELLRAAAAESVPYMRELWDQSEIRSRDTALAAGTRVAEVDLDAFRVAARPVLERHLDEPGLRALHDGIRALA